MHDWHVYNGRKNISASTVRNVFLACTSLLKENREIAIILGNRRFVVKIHSRRNYVNGITTDRWKKKKSADLRNQENLRIFAIKISVD